MTRLVLIARFPPLYTWQCRTSKVCPDRKVIGLCLSSIVRLLLRGRCATFNLIVHLIEYLSLSLLSLTSSRIFHFQRQRGVLSEIIFTLLCLVFSFIIAVWGIGFLGIIGVFISNFLYSSSFSHQHEIMFIATFLLHNFSLFLSQHLCSIVLHLGKGVQYKFSYISSISMLLREQDHYGNNCGFSATNECLFLGVIKLSL